MIGRAIDILRRRGVRVLIRASISRAQGFIVSQTKLFKSYKHLFVGKSGIEIGGRSAVFANGGFFPIYPVVRRVDNYNYSNKTVWNNDEKSTHKFRFSPKIPCGHQYIGEATSMKTLASETFDFVLLSHMLEHTANPILVLNECKRILKPGAVLLLVLPNKYHTFDHRRPVTTLTHLIDDFEMKTTENDLTHLPEILELHDCQRDPDVLNLEDINLRGMSNIDNRCLHHHVFNVKLAVDLLEYSGLEVKCVDEIRPHHIFLLAKTAELKASFCE